MEDDRRGKLERLRERGIDPFPHEFAGVGPVSSVHEAHGGLDGEEAFGDLISLDLGDLIGIDGTAFKSRRGELSLKATSWALLAKSLLPPPDKFHGLEDVETRYRRRELDLLANEEARELVILRSKVIATVRRWLDERGFL